MSQCYHCLKNKIIIWKKIYPQTNVIFLIPTRSEPNLSLTEAFAAKGHEIFSRNERQKSDLFPNFLRWNYEFSLSNGNENNIFITRHDLEASLQILETSEKAKLKCIRPLPIGCFYGQLGPETLRPTRKTSLT